MFDVDEHPRVPEAIELARVNNIGVALSSPCLELWFLIHFEKQTAYIDRKEAQRRSRNLLGCDKVLTTEALERLVGEYEKGKEHARVLARKHKGDGSPKPWNPYADVWELIDIIRNGSPSA
jgi:RloB-like protein